MQKSIAGNGLFKWLIFGSISFFSLYFLKSKINQRKLLPVPPSTSKIENAPRNDENNANFSINIQENKDISPKNENIVQKEVNNQIVEEKELNPQKERKIRNLNEVLAFIDQIRREIRNFKPENSTELNYDDFFEFLQILSQNNEFIPFFFKISRLFQSIFFFLPFFIFDMIEENSFTSFLQLIDENNNLNNKNNENNENNENNNKNFEINIEIEEEKIIKNFYKCLFEFNLKNSFFYIKNLNNEKKNLKNEIKKKIFFLLANLSIDQQFFYEFLDENSQSENLPQFFSDFLLFILKFSRNFEYYSDLYQILINVSSFRSNLFF